MKNLLVGLSFLVLSCGSGGSGSTGFPQDVDNVVYRNIGYSIPNYWDELDPAFYAETLASNHVGLTEIEYTFPDGHADIIAAHKLVSEMRRRGIWTFVNIANANNPVVKSWAASGNDVPFNNRLEDIINAIGTDHIILGAVSEPDGSVAYDRWTVHARSAWTGEFAVPGNHPVVTVVSDWKDVHYCILGNLLRDISAHREGFIFNTDCSPILNPGPEYVGNLTRLAKQFGNTVIIYDFYAHTPDLATLDSMRKALE